MRRPLVSAFVLTVIGLTGCNDNNATKIKRASDDAMSISEQLIVYQSMHGSLPVDLQSLAVWNVEGPRPQAFTLRPVDLIDPWGRPYQSTTPNAGPNNLARMVADVWSSGPPETTVQIGNWKAAP